MAGCRVHYQLNHFITMDYPIETAEEFRNSEDFSDEFEDEEYEE
jgi:hypothetical protein